MDDLCGIYSDLSVFVIKVSLYSVSIFMDCLKDDDRFYKIVFISNVDSIGILI